MCKNVLNILVTALTYIVNNKQCNMDRLPSPIPPAETQNMAFNTQNSQDIDESGDLSESQSLYSPSQSELECLGDYQSRGDESMTGSLHLFLSDNGCEIDEPASPVMHSKRARRVRNQTSRKKGKEQQNKIASDLKAQVSCCCDKCNTEITKPSGTTSMINYLRRIHGYFWN